MSTTTLSVLLEPLDVVLFRDHRPFLMGENFVARSRFPAPSTIYGALRTLLVYQKHGPNWFEHRPAEEITKGVDQISDEYGLSLRGPTYGCLVDGEIEPRLEPSRDLIGLGHPRLGAPRRAPHRLDPWKKMANEPIHLDLRNESADASSMRLPSIREPQPKGRNEVLLTKAGIKWALAQAIAEPTWQNKAWYSQNEQLTVLKTDVVKSDLREGIARDQATRTARDAYFYLAEYLAFTQDAGIAVEVQINTDHVEAFKKLNGQLTRLGGKTRLARVHVREQALFPAEPTDGRPRYWLISPHKRTGNDDLPFKVVSQMTGTDGLPAGGFDFARRAPKPLTPVYPRGSVFYVNDGPSRTTLNSDHAGYGSVLTGRW